MLVNVDDTPTRVAGAFALGAGLGFSPLLGAQIILGMTLAVIFRLNKVAVTAGLFINLPWIQVPYYWAATAAAGWAIGVPVPDDLRASFGALLSISPFSGAFWTTMDALVRPWLLPFAIGTSIGALLIALAAYGMSLGLLRRRAARRLPA